jgi:hypothetical protein
MLHGNFAWSLQIAVFIVYVESVMIFLPHIFAATPRRSLALALGAAHIFSGLILYVATIFFKAGLWV